MFSIRVILLLVFFNSAYGLTKDKKDTTHHDPNVGIIGGHRISIEQVPFIASVRLNSTFHWCGGSIIHERFILTAAHCIVPHREYKVLVGTDKVDEGGKLYDVEKIIVHEEYSNKTSDYDVCLLKLNESLTFGPTIAKVSLPGDEVTIKKGTLLNVTGWGFTDPQSHSIPRHLQQVQVPVVAMKFCRMFYKAQRNLTQRMMCAGRPGRDSCLGDSGGPLTKHNVQIGIVSFGSGCGGMVPGVYTRVRIVKEWIEEKIKHHHKNEEKIQETKIEETEMEMSLLTNDIFQSAQQFINMYIF